MLRKMHGFACAIPAAFGRAFDFCGKCQTLVCLKLYSADGGRDHAGKTTLPLGLRDNLQRFPDSFLKLPFSSD